MSRNENVHPIFKKVLYTLNPVTSDSVFVVVTWPDVQDLMELEGFRENSILINESPLYVEFGYSAYLVRNSWLNNMI